MNGYHREIRKILGKYGKRLGSYFHELNKRYSHNHDVPGRIARSDLIKLRKMLGLNM